MKHVLSFVVVVVVLCVCARVLEASQPLPMLHEPKVGGVSGYNTDIPKPEDILGYKIGEKHTRHHLIVEYFQTIAGISNRVEYGEHGTTYDGRRLVHAVVTSPANHGRIAEIKRTNKLLSTDPVRISDEDLSDLPAIVWMGYGVHGNEASGFEAAILLLYHLAAGEGDEIEALLDDLVVLLIPSLNPDGHSRHVNWVNTNRGGVPVTDPQHREHNEPWPGGRTNYYWFDLNRDWFPLQHPESQGRITLFNEWRPQLVTDFHEFGSNATYFFQPGIPSRYNPHIPQTSIDLLKAVGEFHASALDERAVLYYTRESFDDFYIGKGSTYPMVSGAIGILFEQASSRALKRETARGKLTFDFTILNQFTTSLSTLNACSALREDLLRNQRRFYRDAQDYTRQKGVRAFILDVDTDRTKSQELIRILQQHRINVYELAQRVTQGNHTFEPGRSIIIPTEQAEARLIFAAMERRTEFTDSLFYDISTWTLPLAFNIPYVEYRQNPRNLFGDPVDTIVFDGGILNGGTASYAYVMEWNRYYAPRVLYRLQNEGVIAMVAMRPFTAVAGTGLKEFKRGSIVIPVRQPDVDKETLDKLVRHAVEKDHVLIHALESSRTVEGPDLGSPSMRVLEKPGIAIVAGPGTSAGEVGETWHLLSERMQIPVTLLNTDMIQRADLGRYSTIVMVNGNYNTLSDREVGKIKDWTRSGGTLITFKNATRLAVQNEMLGIEIVETDEDLTGVAYEDVWSVRGADRIGGAIFNAAMDVTHPVAFGYDSRVPLFRNNEIFYRPSESAGETVAVYTDAPLLSGYISDKRLDEIRNTAAIVAQRFGQGRIIAFADNPNFRAFWYGTNGLFLNAIFFGGIF